MNFAEFASKGHLVEMTSGLTMELKLRMMFDRYIVALVTSYVKK